MTDLSYLKDMPPEAFVAERRRLIEAHIKALPPERQQTARVTQAKADAALALCGYNPTLGAAVMCSMISDLLVQLQGHYTELLELVANDGKGFP